MCGPYEACVLHRCARRVSQWRQLDCGGTTWQYLSIPPGESAQYSNPDLGAAAQHHCAAPMLNW